MSVFEDLIDELKNENLLEETVIPPAAASKSSSTPTSSAGAPATSGMRSGSDRSGIGSNSASTDVSDPKVTDDEAEFFRKKVMEEVASLQMVEHVLSAVEREHLKTFSAAYDDLEVKKALHRFHQNVGDSGSNDRADSEFALRQEIEKWNVALFERDQNISVANLRRYCEDSRPVLSSQALISLARFYRNSPFSEDVRAKFDYVMTRLFTRESGEGRRQLLFDDQEMLGHVNRLYADWSSIALFSIGDDSSEITVTAAKFGEFSAEVGSASTFSDLLKSSFFDRVRVFKEECSELFFVPDVVISAIRCNLTIGNVFVELISREREKYGADSVEQKYGVDHDDAVSAAAGKTLHLAEILTLDPLSEPVQAGSAEGAAGKGSRPATRIVLDAETRPEEPGFSLFGVNRWLIAVCVVSILISAGVYIWADKFAPGNESSAVVASPVAIDDASVKQHIKNGRSTKETFYAVTEVSFDTLTEQQKKEYLAKVRAFAESKGLKKVSLLDGQGKSVAFASKDRVDIVTE